MPSRNKVPNAAELVSRSLNCTRAGSPCKRSDMVSASRTIYAAGLTRRLMMNKSLRAERRESSYKTFYGFQRRDAAQKKSRRFRRLLKLITGRRQTEWTGATRCPKEDVPSHNRESLTDRKRSDLFTLHLPCRPLAECVGSSRLEEAVGRVFRCALPGHGGLQPLDFRAQQRDPFGQLLDRQQ